MTDGLWGSIKRPIGASLRSTLKVLKRELKKFKTLLYSVVNSLKRALCSLGRVFEFFKRKALQFWHYAQDRYKKARNTLSVVETVHDGLKYVNDTRKAILHRYQTFENDFENFLNECRDCVRRDLAALRLSVRPNDRFIESSLQVAEENLERLKSLLPEVMTGGVTFVYFWDILSEANEHLKSVREAFLGERERTALEEMLNVESLAELNGLENGDVVELDLGATPDNNHLVGLDNPDAIDLCNASMNSFATMDEEQDNPDAVGNASVNSFATMDEGLEPTTSSEKTKGRVPTIEIVSFRRNPREEDNFSTCDEGSFVIGGAKKGVKRERGSTETLGSLESKYGILPQSSGLFVMDAVDLSRRRRNPGSGGEVVRRAVEGLTSPFRSKRKHKISSSILRRRIPLKSESSTPVSLVEKVKGKLGVGRGRASSIKPQLFQRRYSSSPSSVSMIPRKTIRRLRRYKEKARHLSPVNTLASGLNSIKRRLRLNSDGSRENGYSGLSTSPRRCEARTSRRRFHSGSGDHNLGLKYSAVRSTTAPRTTNGGRLRDWYRSISPSRLRAQMNCSHSTSRTSAFEVPIDVTNVRRHSNSPGFEELTVLTSSPVETRKERRRMDNMYPREEVRIPRRPYGQDGGGSYKSRETFGDTIRGMYSRREYVPRWGTRVGGFLAPPVNHYIREVRTGGPVSDVWW